MFFQSLNFFIQLQVTFTVTEIECWNTNKVLENDAREMYNLLAFSNFKFKDRITWNQCHHLVQEIE